MDIPVAGTPRSRVPGATWQPSAAKMLSCSQEDLHLSFHCFSCFVVLTGHTRASIMGTVYGFWSPWGSSSYPEAMVAEEALAELLLYIWNALTPLGRDLESLF